MFIKNFDDLARTPERKIVLELVEAALASIQPEKVFEQNIRRHGSILTIVDQEFDLDNFERVFLLGFGKGSAGNSKLLEKLILDKLTEGYVIDTDVEQFEKIKFTKGTHPLPSETNYKFTQKVLERLSNLNEQDLVLIVICGGGSAMFVYPHAISLEQKIAVGKSLLKSGASITEMNIVRKHLSNVKGGGLAQILYPAKVAALIYSDVPGNDLSTIASGPTAYDPTTIEDAIRIIKKYNLEQELNLARDAFIENPHDKKYFENVHNMIVLSNDTALSAMKQKAERLGWQTNIFSDRFESEARKAGKKLISSTHHNSILLVGGETTVHVAKKSGRGGRNQEVVLGALEHVDRDITICSFASDGWDNTEHAGAISDYKTVEQAKALGIEPLKYLEKNNSFVFFKETRDGIITGRLPSNVSDLMIILRK
ncbi:MAG: DUF4147 domain-containing protein [Candidatus Levybacteria bacterium]|nr:DUF4147 domain-containing protein [Candidatus Levybacteria bacterium]